jgi:transcriptional regulator with XRE-family HTH domain
MRQPNLDAGGRLRAALVRLGISQTDAAAQCGFSVGSLNDLLRGYRLPTLDRLHQIATALEIDPHTLDSRLASVKPKPKGKIPRTK